jgi:hypothetical protein
MNFRVLALVLFMGSLSCDAQRALCSIDSDCFLGEQCVDQACVASTPDPDMGGDAHVDMPVTLDCRTNPGVCLSQVCNTTTGTCFDCTFDAQCGINGTCDEPSGECQCASGFHPCGGTCVTDDADATCGDRCAPCPDTINGSGICENKACSFQCDPQFQRCGDDCDVSELECVQCLTNAHCPADDAVCSGGNCAACRNDNDCALQPGLPVCSNGSCVQCTEGKKNQCAGNTCNPATNTCSTTQIEAVRSCGRCVSDDDCLDSDQDCVKMKFNGVERDDGYCLYRASAFNCARPYPVRVERQSISGKPETTYCTVNEAVVTCEALLQYGDVCDQDDDCGVMGVNDGLCKPFSGVYRCSYQCESGEDCPPPFGTTVCLGYCVTPNPG